MHLIILLQITHPSSLITWITTINKKYKFMSGVWVFKNNGVMQLVQDAEYGESKLRNGGGGGKRKVLVHLPTGQAVSSYSCLDQILKSLGWERYFGAGHVDLIQFHKRSSIDLISLPTDFTNFTSIYMYDIVVKNPNVFHVRDM